MVNPCTAFVVKHSNSSEGPKCHDEPILQFAASAATAGTRVSFLDCLLWLSRCPTVQAGSVQVSPLAQHRTFPRWPNPRRRGRPFTTERVLYRASQWRRLEDGRLWPHMDAHL